MTAKRKREKLHPSKILDPDNNNNNLFQSLASSISSPQVIQNPILKHLSYILDHLSSTQPTNSNSNDFSTLNWNLNLNNNQTESINCNDVCNLSNILFTKLTNQLTTILQENNKSVTLLLRCCIKITSLLIPNQELTLENAKSLLSFLTQSINNPLLHRTLLEVFIDEVSMNKSLQNLLYLVDSTFSTSRLFSKLDRSGLVEMLSALFISDENRLTVRTSQITLITATSLLLNPVMLSAPRMVHAYTVSLVCDVVEAKGLDCNNLIGRYIDVFDKSVTLYTRHMCKGVNTPIFESLMLPSTLVKVNDVTLKIKGNIVKRGNDELVAYAKECLCLYDTENMLTNVIGGVIVKASSNDVVVMEKYNAYTMEDLYLLGSTVKLMSVSILQIIRFLKEYRFEDVRSCNEYKAMMDVVQRFEKFNVDLLPGQRVWGDRMGSYRSKWMFMEFLGLLSVGFALKLEFLVKASVFGMVVSTYLFGLEGGDVKALGDTVCHSEKGLSSSSIPSNGFKDSGKAKEGTIHRKQSSAVALKFQKCRTSSLGKVSKAEGLDAQKLDSRVDVEEERCNVERFLRSWDVKRSDMEDIADFIACEPGKDYSEWLKGKERVRYHKRKKIENQMWNKKQKAWRENKRKI